MKINSIAIFMSVLSFFMVSATQARTLNELNGYHTELTEIVNDIKNQIVMIRSFNVDISGCDVSDKMMKIEKIVMDEDDRYPEKMKFTDMDNRKITIPTNFYGLDNASRSWTENLFSEGDWVKVQFTICGSGGFYQMTSISKHETHFPKSGITINNIK